MIGRRVLSALLAIAGIAGIAGTAHAQVRGAAALGPLVAGLGTSVRVLVIGAHPDDEDTPLITYLSRGRQATTAYLSLTRGEGGQNLIGAETREALGVLRVAESLAAREIDGAQQYFTRAYDFGPSKSLDEARFNWGTLDENGLTTRDVVRIVRTFRPHVIVSVTPSDARDGGAQHAYASRLAEVVFALAADTTRRCACGVPWTPLKLYRVVRHDEPGADTLTTLHVNVGEYSPVLGRTYVELAAESRSRQRSQGVASAMALGGPLDALRRVATRVGPDEARTERSMFDGIDTTLARLRPRPGMSANPALDSLPAAIARVQAAYRAETPDAASAPLAAVVGLAARAAVLPGITTRKDLYDPDALRSLEDLYRRAQDALVLASGVTVDASATRELVARATEADSSDTLHIDVTLFNRGRDLVQVNAVMLTGAPNVYLTPRALVGPDSAWSGTVGLTPRFMTSAWWLTAARIDGFYAYDVDGRPEADHAAGNEAGALRATVRLAIAGAEASVNVPVVYRPPEPGRLAELPVAVVPGVTVRMDHAFEYARAGQRLARPMRVVVQSAFATERDIDVTLNLPPGLATDTATRRVRIPPGAAGVVAYTVRGVPKAQPYKLGALVTTGADRYGSGVGLISYDHIVPQRLAFPASTIISGVDVNVPAGMFVGYAAAGPDQTPRMLTELGVPTSQLDPAALSLPGSDLSRFTAIAVAPRAYELAPVLLSANPRLFAFARAGGTVVVQYGRNEMEQPGVLPYPVTIGSPAQMVTQEGSVVRLLAPLASALAAPNRIDSTDFVDWVQDRALFVPQAFDPHWRPALEVGDAGEPALRGSLLSAAYGRGTYVYTTLSLFRQLPRANPGAARLFVNLLARGAPTHVAPPRTAPAASR